MLLTREVRFSLDGQPAGPITNSWGGWPACDGIAPFLALRVTVEGSVDPRTGYLCNIIVLDRAVREVIIPALQERWRNAGRQLPAGQAVRDVAPLLARALPGDVRLTRLELRTTPWLRFTWHAEQSAMVAITQSFEFAAAHRLYCVELSEEENRAIFGKCTNPNGHGHNYLVEVTIAGEPDARTGLLLPVGAFEDIVKRHVIDVFDHKHLNEDCPEFAELNPSVENITRVIWTKLEKAFPPPARLHAVRVHETAKTVAEYRG
jgi:6-pyruvoyltetrahydropterin/6-carboxytetrahydropterin synthase